MSSMGPARLSVAALLLARLAFCQDSSSTDDSGSDTSSDGDSTATSTEGDLFSILATPVNFEAPVPTQTFEYPPGDYPIGDEVFTVACETPNSEDGLSPYVIAEEAKSVDDYGACMALCGILGDKCAIALWDFNADTHCVLLTSLTNELAIPGGRCYAAKKAAGLPSSSSYDISSAYYSETTSSDYPTSSEYDASTSDDPVTSDYPVSSEYPVTSRPYPPGPRPSGPPSRPPPPPPSGPYSGPSPPPSPPSSSSSSSSSNNNNNNNYGPPPQQKREDAYCGKGHGPIAFESCPQGDAVYGRCCSRYGYCGNSALYCGDGCLPEFGSCGGDYDPGNSATDFPFSTVYLPSIAPGYQPERSGLPKPGGCAKCGEKKE